MDLLGYVRRSCVFRLDPFDLHPSSAVVAVLVRWFYGALARRLPDCLLQQGLPGSDKGGAMAAARLRLASVLVVVARWSTDLDVIFIISGARCTTMIFSLEYARVCISYIKEERQRMHASTMYYHD